MKQALDNRLTKALNPPKTIMILSNNYHRIYSPYPADTLDKPNNGNIRNNGNVWPYARQSNA